MRPFFPAFYVHDSSCEIGGQEALHFGGNRLRPCIWSKVLNGSQHWEAFRTTRGKGLSIHSSQGVAAIDRAAKHLDDFYMGCIH